MIIISSFVSILNISHATHTPIECVCVCVSCDFIAGTISYNNVMDAIEIALNGGWSNGL